MSSPSVSSVVMLLAMAGLCSICHAVPLAPSLTPSQSFPADGTNCCMRAPRQQSLGLDMYGKQFSVDVGECINICRSWEGDFGGFTPCSGECYPRRTVMERHNLLTGPKEVGVVKSCKCDGAGRCRRLRKQVIYFPGTEFETHLDVGQCAGEGVCGEGERCEAVQTDTKIITGPNGVQMVPVVVKCRCVGGCYRLPDYWQYSEVEGEEGSGGSGVTGVTGVAGEGDVQLHWRMVDVGRCVGRCPQQVTNPLCIRSQENPNECELVLTPAETRGKCFPIARESMEIRTRRNRTETVWKVTECGCGQ